MDFILMLEQNNMNKLDKLTLICIWWKNLFIGLEFDSVGLSS